MKKQVTISMFLFFLLFSVNVFGKNGIELRRNLVVQAVEKTAPAVVNIKAAKVVERYSNPFRDFFGDDFFSPFFGDIFPGYKQKFLEQSLGSGVIIDGTKRLVLTNAHVIMGASKIKVKLLDGREFKADLVGCDPDFDVALLKLRGKGKLPEAKMGTSKDLMVGETVIAIGNPYGFSHTVTTGVVSALNRSIRTKQGTYFGFIQTDAAINPGNSGGPLLNILGEVIGINTAIYAKAEGIGFAIPIDKAKNVIYELLHYGKVQPVWLGIFGQNVDPRVASYLRLKGLEGLLVTEVIKGLPAYKGGIKPGDVIVSINGIQIRDKEDYVRYLLNITSESVIKLKFFRMGKLYETPSLKPVYFTKKQAIKFIKKKWGFWGKEYKGNLLVTNVYPNSPASALGLKPGDVIYKIGGTAQTSINKLIRAYIRYRLQKAVMLVVVRNNHMYYVRMNTQ
ncbi:trypsin-like peptidase domain-containing protein [Desulfothermus sp.]